jgi:hypothetical protein
LRSGEECGLEGESDEVDVVEADADGGVGFVGCQSADVHGVAEVDVGGTAAGGAGFGGEGYACWEVGEEYGELTGEGCGSGVFNLEICGVFTRAAIDANLHIRSRIISKDDR